MSPSHTIVSAWRKSARSGQNGNCVEVAGLAVGTAVRDSKNLAGPVLSFSPAEWRAFSRRVKTGAHDL